MSETNILTPLIDALWDCGKVIYSLITGRKSYDFANLFKNMKLKNDDEVYPKLYARYDSEYYDVFDFTIPTGLCLKDFEKKIGVFSQFFNVIDSDVRIENHGPLARVKVLKDVEINFDYDIELGNCKNRKFQVPLGRRLDDNEIEWWNLISSRNTHTYVAGSTGGGKTIKVRLILSHLINSLAPCDVQLVLQNTKYVDLKLFKNAKHVVKYNEGRDGIIELLDAEIAEMDRRYQLINKHDCDDIAEFRKKVRKIPYRVIVIEEISSYKTNSDGKNNNKFYSKLEDIAARGRGSGQLLILTTQLPSKDVLPNFIKNNINTTIGLRCKDAIRSEIVAGPDSGLEKLKGDGHSKLFPGDVEYQGFYISKEQVSEIVEKNKKKEV